MDRLDGPQADVHRAVHGRARAGQDAGDAEGFVLVIGKALRPQAMGDDQGIAQFVAQGPRDLGAQNGVEQVRERPPGAERQGLLAGVTIMAEVVARGAQHAEPTVGIAERQRHRPGHVGPVRDVAVAFPGDVVGRVADAEHGIQQKLYRAAARTDDQVGAGNGGGETGLGLGPKLFHAEHQGHADGQRQQGQPHGRPAVQQALDRKTEDRRPPHAA